VAAADGCVSHELRCIMGRKGLLELKTGTDDNDPCDFQAFHVTVPLAAARQNAPESFVESPEGEN